MLSRFFHYYLFVFIIYNLLGLASFLSFFFFFNAAALLIIIICCVRQRELCEANFQAQII